jgi:hypothetical protein
MIRPSRTHFVRMRVLQFIMVCRTVEVPSSLTCSRESMHCDDLLQAFTIFLLPGFGEGSLLMLGIEGATSFRCYEALMYS